MEQQSHSLFFWVLYPLATLYSHKIRSSFCPQGSTGKET